MEGDNEKNTSDRIDPPKIQETVEALLAVNKHWRKKLEGEDKMKLFDDHEMFELQVTMWKIIGRKIKKFAIPLPNNMYQNDRDALLFVKDIPKEKGEMCVHHYKELLAEKGVTGISEIIPVNVLLREYRAFEAKRKLAKSYDVFLADHRVSRTLTCALGKEFLSRNKYPIFVKLDMPNLKEHVSEIMRSAHMNLSNRGSCSSVNIAHTGMPVKEVVENVQSAISIISKQVQGEWKNIKAIHLRTRKSISLPIYTNLLQAIWDIEKIAAPKLSNEDLDNLEVQMILEKKQSIKSIRKQKDLHPDEPLKKKRYRKPALKPKGGLKERRSGPKKPKLKEGKKKSPTESKVAE